jgi:hypothetical protein
MGMAGVEAANDTGLTRQQSTKWWNVSASLRGFYDDNISQASNKEGSPGLEFEPSVGVNIPREQTLMTAKYTFRLNYFADRPDEPVDYHHQFDARINHRFSERYTLNFENSFVYSSEPEVIAGGSVPVGFGRIDSTAVRNFANLDFNARLTRLVGVGIGYRNAFYDYQEDAHDVVDPVDNPEGVGSRSAMLDRVEHLIHVEGEYYFSTTTIGFLGYQFGLLDYTSDDPLGVIAGELTYPDERNSLSHYFYVGGAHTFSQQLSGIARVGVQYLDYYNLDETDLSPYADISGTYTYLPGSSVRLGVKVSHAATDLVGSNELTRDQLATAFYANWAHRITAKITGNLFGQYIHSVFNGGDFDGETEGFLNVGVSFNYQINSFVAANMAYSYDQLFSDIQFRDFDRNRVWAGFIVSY